MTPTRWLLTIVSFAATIGVSLYLVVRLVAAGGVAHPAARARTCSPPRRSAVEVLARALKIRWSARAAGIQISLGTAARTCLGGDFAAAITPARRGAEPARFFVLSETGLRVVERARHPVRRAVPRGVLARRGRARRRRSCSATPASSSRRS